MSEPPPPFPSREPPARRKPWKQRALDWVVHQLTQGITPEKLALTLAVGSACGVFPLVGTTTLLCFILGVLLRLNQPAIQVVNGICTPIHLPIILLLYHLGNALFGVRRATYGMRFFSNMFWVLWDTPRVFAHQFGVVAWHLVVAWSLLAPFWIVLVYFVTLPVLKEIERRRVAGALH